MKPFEIQSSTLTIGGIKLQAGTTGVVIPGVTQATSYKVEEVNDTGDQTITFQTIPEVLDAVSFADLSNGTPGNRASYEVEELDDGYIDSIDIVNGGGSYTSAEANTNANANMYAYTGSAPDHVNPFVPNDWTQIPFRPKMRAGEVENIGGGGATNEITNTDGTSTYSVSVATTGIVTMTTGRGGIEFGAMPEIGGPEHLHIMRPAGQNGSTDLFFGDDFNYVKLPGLYGAGTQGVEIGSSFNEGAVSVWNFGTDGNITLPSNTSKINYANGTSILSGGGASTGDIEFSNGNMTGSDGDIRMQVQNLAQTGYYSLTPGVDYSTAVWDGTGITFNDPVQNVYDAIWALTSFSTIQVQVSGNWFTVTSSGSSTPGMPQAPTLYVNEPAVGGPLNIDIAELTIRQGTTSYAEISGNDFRVDVQDDIRMYSNDTFILVNKSTTDSIQIETSDGDYTWEFDASGNLTLPSGGDILNSTGTSVLFNGDYTNLTNTPTLFSGDYDDLTDKPTSRQTVLAGSGPGGNDQADALVLAGINPVTNIPSTYGGDLILQGGAGGSNGDLYGEIRIKSGTVGSNYEWHFTSDKKIKLPAGGDIVNSSGTSVLPDLTQYISVSALKTLVAASTDFADFQTRIASL